MPLTPLNVLLADEETTIVELFGEYLRVSGHEVRVVRRAEDLPDALARVDLDVVVLDEGLAGGELVEHLHALRRRGVATLITSRAGAVASAVRALQAGAADYLHKPFKLREAHRAMVQAAEAARDAREAARLEGPAVALRVARSMRRETLNTTLRDAAALVCAQLGADSVLIAAHDPAVGRWIELQRAHPAMFARLDLDAVGALALKGEELPPIDQSYFGAPGPRLRVLRLPIDLPEAAGPPAELLLVLSRPTREEDVHLTPARLMVQGLGLGIRSAICADRLRPGPPPSTSSESLRLTSEARLEQAWEQLMLPIEDRRRMRDALRLWCEGLPLRVAAAKAESGGRGARTAALFCGAFERHDGYGGPLGLAHRAIPLPSAMLRAVLTWGTLTGACRLCASFDSVHARVELDAQSGPVLSPLAVSMLSRVLGREGSRGATFYPEDTMLPED